MILFASIIFKIFLSLLENSFLEGSKKLPSAYD